MELVQSASAGTLESCDIQITVGPNPGGGRDIFLDSIVKYQFGRAIVETVEAVLDDLDVGDVQVDLFDKGAFDHVIRARLETAVLRAAGRTAINWEGR